MKQGLVLLAVLTAACGRPAAPPDRTRPNILLVTIDTLRADRVGAGLTPALDRVAATGLRFTNARSAVPLTLPSHTTILTGLLPPAHGVRQNGSGAPDTNRSGVATRLKSAGYRTAAFVGAFVLDHQFGLASGFDDYDDRIPRDPAATERLEAERPASAVVDAALEWFNRGPVAAPQSPTPFFVWIHLYDPHAPYHPPREYVKAKSTPPTLADWYDGEIAYADAQIARVFDWLRQRSLLSRTMVIVAGDHGEGLGDHGEQTHGMLLYDSTLRVPLMAAGPDIATGASNALVGLVDVAPTILATAGVEIPREMTGRDLVRLKAEAANTTTDSYAETEYPRVAGWSALAALTDGRWKAIRAGATTELYDLQNDPHEQHDLASAQGSRATAMASRLDVLTRGGAHSEREISTDARERLRALGYVAPAASANADAKAVNPATRINHWNAFEDALTALNAHRADALPVLARLGKEEPDAPVFQSTYARALKDAGRTTDALEAYRRAAKRWPTDADLLHDLAVAARDAANATSGPAARALTDEARRAEEASMTLAPASALARNGLGLIAIDEERYADAVRAFEDATRIDGNNPSYWANLGNARRALHDPRGAEDAYRRALAVDARTADAANGLGVLLVEAHKPADAVAWFEQALAAQPDFVEARLNLGIALQQSGDTARAADAFRTVLNAGGHHPREKAAARELLAASR